MLPIMAQRIRKSYNHCDRFHKPIQYLNPTLRDLPTGGSNGKNPDDSSGEVHGLQELHAGLLV
jgi:hypothetical protein